MRLGYAASTALVLDLDDAFRLAAELELDFVELAWDLQELDPGLQPVERVRELCRATGVGTTVHLPFVDLNLASLMPGVRENSVARVQRGIDYAAEVGASCGVLHTGTVPARHPRVLGGASQALTASLRTLTPHVPVALENTALDYYDLLRGPEELETVTAAAGEGFANTLDLGHAVVEGASTERRGLEGGLARLDSYLSGLTRVVHLHLHDNDGTADQHRPAGSGSLPWEAKREYLRSFPGTACLEIAGGPEGVRRSVSFLRELLG
ncbi:MAG TPA: sugar phosphate isomerase/epimerase family protein [Deinococcales bacterium]|nr:sugar phosphate isomerase/epimerase family protein [Deinococcales bacterium]